MRIIRYTVLLALLPLASCGKEPMPSLDSLVNAAVEVAEAERFVPKKLFHLSNLKIDPFTKNAQGMDIYDDRYLFQAGIEQNTIHVIDLQESKALGTIWFATPSGESCHMNNINCGVKLYSFDKYPVIYLSQTEKSKACFVLRLDNNLESFQIIQTIYYSGTGHYLSNSAFDWFIDPVNNLIYTYGKYNGDSNKREIMKFPLPTLDAKEISFTDDDILDSFVLEDQSIYQGSRIIDGLLYAPVGYGNTQHPGRLIIIDLGKKEVVGDIPLSIGEPEAIGKYKSGAIISTGGKNPVYYFIAI